MTCPSVDTVAELVCRRLAAPEAHALEVHIADCDRCRELVATLARSSLVRIPSGTPAPLASESQPMPVLLRRGNMVGRFEILECIGAGGMGIVYAGRDPELDRTVAVKVLRPELAVGAETRTLLLSEAQALARLKHPNVITVYEVGTVGDRVFVAMERLNATLRSWLERPRTTAEIVRVFAAAGQGLAAAHAAGLVHRDFKPENVLIDDDGRVCVSDFGLAIGAGSHDPDIAGTPAYMAPEQRAGMAADAAADQYAFCLVLQEALSGTRTPRWLERTIRRGLARDPKARYPSMAALVGELQRDRGRRRIAVLVGACLVAETAVLVIGARYLASSKGWRPVVVDLEAFEENSDDPAISPDGTQLAYISDRGHTGRFVVYVGPLRAGRGAHQAMSDPAGNCYPARWTHDGRALVMGCQVNGEQRVVQRAVDGAPETRDLGPGVPYDVCGDKLLVGTRSGRELVLRDPGTLRDESLLRIPDADRFRRARCTLDGTRIVYARIPGAAFRFVSDIYLIDRQRKITQLSPARAPHSPEVTSLGAFTPDGKSVVLSLTRDHKTNLYEVPIDRPTELRQLTFGDGPDLAPDVSRDGTILVYNRDTTSGPLFVTDEHGSTQLTQRLEFYTRIRPAMKDLVVAERLDADGMQVVAVDVASGNARTLAAGRLPIVSSDGAMVAFTPVDDATAIHQVPLAGSPVVPIARLPGRIVEGASGPDGMHVLVDRGGALEGWRIAPDGSTAAEGVAGLVLPAPDGKWRAVAARDERGNVRVTFVAPGASIATPSTDAITARSFSLRWVDATRFGYCDLSVSCRVLDVTTRGDVAVTNLGPGYLHAIAALDGKRWFSHGIRGRVTRHLITNFATRH